MSEPAQSVPVEPVRSRALSLTDKAATLAALVLACVLFLSVGRLAMAPDDPLGPVSLFARHGAMTMWLQAAALSGVAAGLTTLMVGRRFGDMGVFAAALGITLVSLHGATSEYFLVQAVEESSTGPRGLALRFAVEAGGWFAVVIVAGCVSTVVMWWCWRTGTAADHSRPHPRGRGGGRRPAPQHEPTADPMGYDVPGLSTRLVGGRPRGATIVSDGLKHMLFATGAALAAMTILSTGLSARVIHHGQVCFVVGTSVFFGSYAAHRFVPVRSALWSVLSVALLAGVGYAWAALRTPSSAGPPNIPSSQFMRVLPIQFMGVGTASALAAFWYLGADGPEPEARRPRHEARSGRKGRP